MAIASRSVSAGYRPESGPTLLGASRHSDETSASQPPGARQPQPMHPRLAAHVRSPPRIAAVPLAWAWGDSVIAGVVAWLDPTPATFAPASELPSVPITAANSPRGRHPRTVLGEVSRWPLRGCIQSSANDLGRDPRRKRSVIGIDLMEAMAVAQHRQMSAHVAGCVSLASASLRGTSGNRLERA
jgi:hypothetical protein